MPHASYASRAGSHGTPRLQAQRPAKSFDINLTLSRYHGFCLPELACKARTGGLPLSLDCRCLAWVQCSALSLAAAYTVGLGCLVHSSFQPSSPLARQAMGDGFAWMATCVARTC